MIVDYDVNIDDVVALAYLMKDPAVDVVAVIVTTTAFATSGPAIDNTYKLLQLLGKNDIDVGIGPRYAVYDQDGFPANCTYHKAVPRDVLAETNTLLGLHNQLLAYSPRVYYKDTATDGTAINQTAAAVYAKHADAGVDTVLTLGSMTSLDSFLTEYPESFAKLKNLVAMFGAINVPGNIWSVPGAEHAEYNGVLDPHSAANVLATDNWESLLLVPLDATNKVPMTQEYMDDLAKLTTPEGVFVYELTLHVQNTWHSGPNGFLGQDENGVVTEEALKHAYFFWDPLAAIVMLNTSAVMLNTTEIEVVASTPADLTVDGWTKVTPGGINVTYASDVTPEQAHHLQHHLAEMLEKNCIVDQPLPMQSLFEMLSDPSCTGEDPGTNIQSDSAAVTIHSAPQQAALLMAASLLIGLVLAFN